MPIEIVYYNTERNGWLEQKLGEFGSVSVESGEDRRGFLVALSQAVSRCDIIIAVGAVSTLSGTLAKGLGLPLTPIDWDAIGIKGEEGASLPQGALPLLVDGSVYGMIIESAAQCIIAIDSDESAVKHLTETYITDYVKAIGSKPSGAADDRATETESGQSESAENISGKSNEPDVSDKAEESVAEEVSQAPSQTEQEDGPQIQPVEYIDQAPYENDGDSQPDIFADIENDDFLMLDVKKHRHGGLIALICIIAVLVIGTAAGFFGYTLWWVPKQYDDAQALFKSEYNTDIATSAQIGALPSDYSMKFASLYAQNPDVIGWISADSIGISLPIVTGAGKQADYYESRLFDGRTSKYGTPYIKYAYDTAVNVNPNLVVYGNNFGDGRAFAGVEKLLDKATAQSTAIRTDSVFYGEDGWQIFSVMLLAADGSEYNYADNFSTMTAAERITALKNALKLSKVDLGISESDFDSIGLNDTFLTLVAPYSADKSKVVVAMAIREKREAEYSAPIAETEPQDGSSDLSEQSETDSQANSDTATED